MYQLRDWRSIRQHVDRLMRAKRWTQSDLAEFLGLRQQSDVSRYMNGKLDWPAHHLEKIAELLGEHVAIFYVPTDERREGLREAREILVRALREIDDLLEG